MNVIRHHNPIIQDIVFPVKVLQSLANHLRYFRLPQMTPADPSIKIPFDFAVKLSVDLLGLANRRFDRRIPHGFRVLTFEAQQYFLWQGINQPKRDKI